MYEPKYRITDQILLKIARIEAIRAEVGRSYILPAREAEMRYRATVEATHSSTSIEGNRLNTRQVDAVLSNKLSRKDYAEIEVKNYKRALDFIEACESQKLTEGDVLKIHSLLTNKLLDETRVGKWRKNNVYIENQDGEVIYTGPSPADVPNLMFELLEWINSHINSVHPVILAAILHYGIASVHPFADGNGRTARASVSLLLKILNYDFKSSLVLDSFYSTDRAAYYFALGKPQGHTFNAAWKADLTSWIEYFADGFLVSADVLNAEVKLLSTAASNLSRHMKRAEIEIIDYIAQFRSINIGEAMDILPDISKRSIQRILSGLVEDGVLAILGDARGTQYILRPVDKDSVL